MALVKNATLTTLVLGSPWRSSGIGTLGAHAIAEALSTNATLTMLDLFNNQIGDAGAEAIAEALQVNASLTKLNLGNTRISDVGAQAIANGLASNVWIVDLSIDHLSDPGRILLQRNQALKKSRVKRLKSLFSAMGPSSLLYEGRDVYREVGRSIRRAQISLDSDDLLPSE
jgi:Ran GTPase-activating protein (RanGAP) involved in mRNA processing and transport